MVKMEVSMKKRGAKFWYRYIRRLIYRILVAIGQYEVDRNVMRDPATPRRWSGE